MSAPALVVAWLLLGASWFHPIHAARLEVGDGAAAGTITVVIHVYRDDFPVDTNLVAVSAYLDRVVSLVDARGARVALRATGVTGEGDRLRIALAGHAAATLSRGRIAVTLLQERYPDQVNVVDAQVGGRHAQLLFLRGDPPQALP